MKILFSCLVVLLLSCFAVTQAQAETAEEAVKKAWELYRKGGAECEKIEVEVSRDGRTEKKSMTRWTKYYQHGEDKIIIKFSEPASDKGLGLLIYRKNSGDEQWLKLPSMGSVRKISMSDQSKYFGGTDLTYEDVRMLAGEKTSDWSYVFDSRAKGMVIATPRSGVETEYGKRVIFLSEKYVINQINYFDKKDRLIKSLINDHFEYFGGRTWRPMTIMVDNKKLSRTSVFRFKERSINSVVPDNYFTKDFLLSERYK